MPRDENEIFSLNLRLRDEIENFCLLISKFETRSRILNETSYVIFKIASPEVEVKVKVVEM